MIPGISWRRILHACAVISAVPGVFAIAAVNQSSTGPNRGKNQVAEVEVIHSLDYTPHEQGKRFLSIALFDANRNPVRAEGTLKIRLGFDSGVSHISTVGVTTHMYSKHYTHESSTFPYLPLWVPFPKELERKNQYPTILSLEFHSAGQSVSLRRPQIIVNIAGSTETFISDTRRDSSGAIFSLELSKDRESYRAGEPITIQCKLVNRWDRTTSIPGPDEDSDVGQRFAFAVTRHPATGIPTVYPKGIFSDELLSKFKLLRAPGFRRGPEPHTEMKFAIGDGPVWRFDLLNGGGSRGWAGKLPGLTQSGTYTIVAIYSHGIFDAWSDGMRAIVVSNPITIRIE